MKIGQLIVLLITISLNAACQKDSTEAIPVVSGIEIPFEEIEINCFIARENEWVIHSEQELMKAKNFFSENCRSYQFPEIDFEKYSLLGYYVIVGGCRIPDAEHHVFIENRKLVFQRVITQNGCCKPGFNVENYILVPKMNNEYDIEFREERRLNCRI